MKYNAVQLLLKKSYVCLDVAVRQAARTALHAHMQKLKLNGQKG